MSQSVNATLNALRDSENSANVPAGSQTEAAPHNSTVVSAPVQAGTGTNAAPQDGDGTNAPTQAGTRINAAPQEGNGTNAPIQAGTGTNTSLPAGNKSPWVIEITQRALAADVQEDLKARFMINCDMTAATTFFRLLNQEIIRSNLEH
jgi:hypothetical protein